MKKIIWKEIMKIKKKKKNWKSNNQLKREVLDF